jgi:alpha-aminoadipate carrier protein LysW
MICPECEAPLTLTDDLIDGEIVPCADCGAELEVLTVEPLTLALAPQIQEDWGE